MGIDGPQRWSVYFGENLLLLLGFEPRKSRTTLFSIPIKLYRLPNDDDDDSGDDDDDDGTNESILLIINPCHDDSWGSGQGMKGLRLDVVVPGTVRIDYTHTSRTANEKKCLHFELKAIIIKHKIQTDTCMHKCTGDVYGTRSLCPKQHCSTLRQQILMTKHS